MGAFDIQVNGYGGVDFNQDDLRPGDLRRACEALARDGADGILATIITEDLNRMALRIRQIVRMRESDDLVRRMVAGIHVEGPFISPEEGYRGAHPADAICPADLAKASRLLDAGEGHIRLVTLAPEMDEAGAVTSFFRNKGVTVAAGHTNASLDQLRRAIDSGLSMMTHLGNGCPLQLPRHDNIIQRVLSLREHLWLSFIADGVHVPFVALKNYLALVGPRGRALVTTDAMMAAGLGPGTYTLNRWSVTVREDLAAWAPDGTHLVGSALSMPRVLDNLRDNLALDATQITSLTDSNPRAAIGLPTRNDWVAT